VRNTNKVKKNNENYRVIIISQIDKSFSHFSSFSEILS